MPSVEEAWRELQDRGVARTLIRLDEVNPANLYAGLDERRRPGLIAISDQELPDIEPLAALDIQYQRVGDKTQLEIWLDDHNLNALFSALCNDLASYTSVVGASNPVKALVTRLEDWRRMLELGRDGLDRSALRGLVGELLVLEHLMGLMPPTDALKGWNGGFPASHDFVFEDFHVEAKTLGPNANSVKITSLDQLDVHYDIKLFLAIAFVVEANEPLPRGFSLSSLTTRINEKLVQPRLANDFNAKLASRGAGSAEAYDAVSFRLDSLRYFRVADHFPKVTRASVVPEVLSASYSIALSAIEPYEDLLERYR